MNQVTKQKQKIGWDHIAPIVGKDWENIFTGYCSNKNQFPELCSEGHERDYNGGPTTSLDGMERWNMFVPYKGGVFGIMCLLGPLIAQRHLGALVYILLLLLGQLGSSLPLDHIGFMGMDKREVSATKVLG